jgi:hypothetical protein
VFAPFNSTLPKHSRRRNTFRLTRKHSRLSLAAAGALAAGAFSAAGVAAGAAPWAETVSDVASSTPIASDAFAGQAGNSSFDAVAGRNSAAPPHAVQLDAWDVHTLGGAITSPAAASAMIRYPASSWVLNLALLPVAKAPAAKGSAAKGPGAHGAAAHAPATRPAASDQVTSARVAGPEAISAHPAAAHPAAAHPAPARPYIFYDSVTPTAIPWGQRVATYVNGNYQASRASVAGRGQVLWIDTNGSDPWANALDVEPGDATPAGAAQWVYQKVTRQPDSAAIGYTMRSEWQGVKSAIAGLPSWM